jgi:hypothetical protein
MSCHRGDKIEPTSHWSAVSTSSNANKKEEESLVTNAPLDCTEAGGDLGCGQYLLLPDRKRLMISLADSFVSSPGDRAT